MVEVSTTVPAVCWVRPPGMSWLGEVTCCSPSAAGLFVLGAFQRSSVGLEPAKASLVQKSSFTNAGHETFNSRGAISSTSRSGAQHGGCGKEGCFQESKKKTPKTQDREVFLPPASQERLGQTAHACTPMHTRVQQPGTKQGRIWGAFGVDLGSVCCSVKVRAGCQAGNPLHLSFPRGRIRHGMEN